MSYSPFEVSKSIGTNLSNTFTKVREESAIDSILSTALKSDDPAVLQQSIGKILSQVSPERQSTAINILMQRAQILKQKSQEKRDQEAYKNLGVDPSIHALPPALQAQILKGQQEQQQYGGFFGSQQPAQNSFPNPPNPMAFQENTQQQPLAPNLQHQERYVNPYRNLSDDKLVQGQTSNNPQIRRGSKAETERRAQEEKASKSSFEPESEKLEAKRVADLSTQIEKDYSVANAEDMRLNRMEALVKKGGISTPTVVKALDFIGIPIGILQNPDTEEYRKLETDFIRDARDVFPGGRITNYEIQSYLKTIPTLMNSKEGQLTIIRNRKLLNEAKKFRYDEYKNILKESKGRRPQNMGIIIEERTQGKIAELEDRFKEGIQKEIGKFQQPIRMMDPQGRAVNIPPDQIENALKAGAKFQ